MPVFQIRINAPLKNLYAKVQEIAQTEEGYTFPKRFLQGVRTEGLVVADNKDQAVLILQKRARASWTEYFSGTFKCFFDPRISDEDIFGDAVIEESRESSVNVFGFEWDPVQPP